MTILCVCPNAAVDVTYEVDRLAPGASHRVLAVRSRVGGKGVNVARVARNLGAAVATYGFCGGVTGTELRAGLDDVDAYWTATAAPSRCTVTVVDPSGATVFNEPGGPVTAAEWTALRDTVRTAIPTAAALVLAGSLPTGCPADAYAQLVADTRGSGVPVLVDASGEPLRHALAARPDLVKPNADEAAQLLGRQIVTADDAVAAAVAMCRAGAGAALVSRGGAGCVLVTADGAWSAALPAPLPGNPTGAGDALAAALAVGLAAGDPWPELLGAATAVAAAAVREPIAGRVDPAAVAELRPSVQVTEL